MKVSQVIRKLKSDGWYLHTTRGSHRQFKHSKKPGRVTLPGKLGDSLAPGTLNSIYNTSWLEVNIMKYAIVIEQTETNYSAYVPDLPGCVASGASIEQVEQEIRTAIRFHLDGLQEDGEAIPKPRSSVEYVEIAA